MGTLQITHYNLSQEVYEELKTKAKESEVEELLAHFKSSMSLEKKTQSDLIEEHHQNAFIFIVKGADGRTTVGAYMSRWGFTYSCEHFSKREGKALELELESVVTTAELSILRLLAYKSDEEFNKHMFPTLETPTPASLATRIRTLEGMQYRPSLWHEKGYAEQCRV